VLKGQKLSSQQGSTKNQSTKWDEECETNCISYEN
jgi:hypothetical protein